MQNQIIVHLNFAKGFRGGESQTQLLVQELSLRGYKQKLIVRQNSELGKRMENTKGLTIIELKKPYAFHLNTIKDAYILHAHETKAAQFAYIASLFYKIPYIITRRVDIDIKNNFFNKNIYKNSYKIIVLSHAIKYRVQKLYPHSYIEIIPDAITLHQIDSKQITHLKKRFNNKFIIGNIAALEKSKGQQYIINAAKQMQDSHPHIHFILLGRGKDELQFKEDIKNLSNITFEGFVNNVGDYLSIFDMFIFPSLSEGFGSSILDAMQFKVPVVAFDIGGIPDIIEHNHNGILVPPKDSEAIFNAIEKLYLSQGFREKLSSNAYKNIENFSYEKMADRYLELYEKSHNV